MVFDFHTHTFLSDGALSPIEQIRRAVVNGYRAIALTDHVGIGGLSGVLPVLERDCALAEELWSIVALPGVELTHIPPQAIGRAAKEARAHGAKIVIVHGETLVEPVEPGTNRAALACPDVHILAHPGLLTPEEAQMAAARGIFLEVSARRGHSLSNGHVVAVAKRAGAALLLDSDAHDEQDLLTPDFARAIARGAAIAEADLAEVLENNPARLIQSLGRSLSLQNGGEVSGD
jgi:histidinol phosphatase-like PHP family hydrolase